MLNPSHRFSRVPLILMGLVAWGGVALPSQASRDSATFGVGIRVVEAAPPRLLLDGNRLLREGPQGTYQLLEGTPEQAREQVKQALPGWERTERRGAGGAWEDEWRSKTGECHWVGGQAVLNRNLVRVETRHCG